MRKALLLYNPESGRRRARRLRDVEAAAAAFRAAGVEPVLEATREPGSSAAQARAAIQRGCDSVIICGGDGTVHEALPALVGAPVALGVVPLGTGNGLANDLGLPRDPGRAANMLAAAVARPTAVARIEYIQRDGQPACRYWIMAAGIGADAEMVYRLTLGFKQRWGMAAYYAESTRQWLRHDFPLFTAEFRDQRGELHREQVSQVLAIRISWFGGLLKSMATAAALTRDDFHLVLFKTRNRLTYLRYMLGVSLERPWPLQEVEILPAGECRCLPLEHSRNSRRIYAEADGELLGTLPASVSMTSETVNLLVPKAQG